MSLSDHPRMRGEDQSLVDAVPSAEGITPACAGKTRNVVATFWDLWDHPRMRGEDLYSAQNMTDGTGSPPHARGRPTAR